MPEPNKGDGGQIAALQSQIENLNKGIAGYRAELDELKKNPNPATSTDDELELSPKDKKRLEAWAKENGLLTREEFEKEQVKSSQDKLKNIENDAVSAFLKKHPEYDDDKAWKKVLDSFSIYKQPTTRKGYDTILNKIHADLSGEVQKEDAKAKVKAEDKKKELLSVSKGSTASSTKDGEPDVDTLTSLKEKYPNLSEDQIKERLQEIRSLYPNDKKE